MKIKYDVVIEDLVALSRYHYRNTPALRRANMCGKLLVAALIFLVVYLINEKPGVAARAIPAALISGLFLLAWSNLQWSGLEKQVRKMYDGRANKGALGEHEIEIGDQGVRERTEFGEQFTKWAGIEKIAFDDDRTYIYVSACTAHVIPKAGIREGAYESIVAALQDKTPHRR